MADSNEFVPVKLSLSDLLGRSWGAAAVAARAALTGQSAAGLSRLADRKVDFFPAAMQRRLARMLPKVGQRVCPPLKSTARGASTAAFDAATRTELAPLAGWGYYRVGESGRLCLLSKSEHYHAPLGHSFPGYRLIDLARQLGLPNATHNNTRGLASRVLEEQLVRTANGLSPRDRAGLRSVLAGGQGLNRVINLETGSLAAEAGLKLMLARFYQSQPDAAPAGLDGRTPVFVVVGDDAGGLGGNYHGTTIVAQMLRGMWPKLAEGMGRANLMSVAAVRPNCVEDLEATFRNLSRGPRRIAGLVCELVLMNYGGRRLSEGFVRRADELCRQHDVPWMVDEIQTCLWSPELFMFREYGVQPDMVALGKGFPGGEYPASRILFNSRLDCLPQFGALVTNGQEELASLAYLVTMRWAEANAKVTAAIGQEYQSRLEALAAKYPSLLAGVDGRRHMTALCFHELPDAKALVKRLVGQGLDISVQVYKDQCPPAALTKLPLIMGRAAVRAVVERIDSALASLTRRR